MPQQPIRRRTGVQQKGAHVQGHKKELRTPPAERTNDDLEAALDDDERQKAAKRREVAAHAQTCMGWVWYGLEFRRQDAEQREVARRLLGEHMDGTGIWQYTYKCRELGTAPILQVVVSCGCADGHRNDQSTPHVLARQRGSAWHGCAWHIGALV